MLRIYMNEHMKEKEPENPVIAVYDTDTKRLTYTDRVDIVDDNGNYIGEILFEPKGVKGVPHEVRASIKIYSSTNIRMLNGQS